MLGKGIVKGLGETARNFFGSYAKEDRLITVQYPEEKLPVPGSRRLGPNYRCPPSLGVVAPW